MTVGPERDRTLAHIEQRWPPDDPDDVRSIVLILPGGSVTSVELGTRARWGYRRMVPFARTLHRRHHRDGLQPLLLRYRYRGWNEPYRHPVEDARWALGQLRDEYPGRAVVLLGHSMGGRVALRVADEPNVVAVCALAPWLPEGEPVRHLDDRSLVIAHGRQDRTTSPQLSLRYAERAKDVTKRVCRFEMADGGHAMVRRGQGWSRLVIAAIDTALGFTRMTQPIEGYARRISTAMRQPNPGGLRELL